MKSELRRSLASLAACTVVAIGVSKCSPRPYEVGDTAPPECENQALDGNETATDCGGDVCPKCAFGKACLLNLDCASGNCDSGICRGATSASGGTAGVSGVGGRGGTIGNGGIAGAALTGGSGGFVAGGAPGSGGSLDPSAGAPNAAGGATSPAGGAGGFDAAGGSDKTGGSPGSGGTSATGGIAGAGGSTSTISIGGTISTGGVSTGGVSTGGVSTGGVSTGGVSTGGVSTGGVSTGGVSTGGVSTGGVSTGGVSTGGAATGGSAGSGPNDCRNPLQPSGALITQFAEFTSGTTWTTETKTWGSSSSNLTGTTFSYGGSSVTVTESITAGGRVELKSTIPSGSWAGFGLAFAPCTNASSYAGISAMIGGTLGGSTLKFMMQTAQTAPVDASANRGECPFTSEATKWSDCVFNRVTVSGVSTTVATFSYTWSQLTGGVPVATVDPTKLLGVQWQFECTSGSSCTIDVTLDNVTFY